MRKTLQKLLTFIVAAVMIVAMIPAAPVNAEDDYDDYTITLKPGDGTGTDITITDGSGIDDYLIDDTAIVYRS